MADGDDTTSAETRAQRVAALAAAATAGAALWGPGRLWAPAVPFEVDPDEGGNLMKALLIGDGLRPWTDQPPLMPWLWSITGDVGGGRLLTAMLVLFGVAAAAVIALRAGPVDRSSRAAIVGTVVGAVFSLWPGMIVASRALLIGLPSLALATLATLLALGSRRAVWLAAPLAAAAMTARFSAAIPLGAAFIALAVGRRAQGALAIAIGTVAGSAVAFACSGAALAAVHLDARHALVDVGASLTDALLPGVALLAPASLLAPLLIRRGVAGTWAAVVLAGACAFVAVQTPRWWHHGLTVGWAVAVVIGAATAWGLAGTRRRAVVTVVAAACGGGVLVGLTLPATRSSLTPLDEIAADQDPCTPKAAAAALSVLPAGIVITDRPMVAAVAGHRAPPSLAVVSLKRRATGLTTRVLLDELDRAAATGALRGVYLERFPWAGVENRLPAGLQLQRCRPGVIFGLM